MKFTVRIIALLISIVMLVSQLKSKIHRAMVTRGDVEYEGSIEIPEDLVNAAGIWPGEKVLVACFNFSINIYRLCLWLKRG